MPDSSVGQSDTSLGARAVMEDGQVDWQARAVAHAQAIASMLAVKGTCPGTFGEQWMAEAKETCRLDLDGTPCLCGRSHHVA